jgi:nuclear pore complex protein Nup93
MAYAAVVKDLNDARLNQQPFNVISAFRKASSKHIIDRQQELIASLWDLLARMLGIQKEKLGMLHSGHFTKIYAKYRNHESSHEILKFRNTLIKGSREWLQESFRAYVAKHVREQQVEIGGIPSVHSEVEAYIKLKFKSNGRWAVSWLDQSIGRVPFWAHLYLLVRMGLLNEALEYIQEHVEQLSSSKDSNFFAYFRAWINSSDGRLPKPLRDSLIGEWNARIRDFVTNSKSTPKGDAFKYALYKMIGRCELNIKTIRNSDVIRNTEDYIWFQSILISEESNSVDAAFEKYTLGDFSLTMQKFGKDYFQKTETWFMVLLCCGEFEKAVNELANEQFFAQDALHFSIAMAYLGVLNVPENPRTLPVANTLLSISSLKIGNTEYPTHAFHFARMIALLVRDWIQSNPLEMMQYIYLIGIFGKSLESSKGKDISLSELDSGREYTKYIHSLTKDILTQSGSATILIGQLREDGQGRTPGPVEKYKLLMHLSTEQEFLDRIILSAAEQCDQEGRLKDALELYNLSCQPNKVLELLVRQIGDSLQSRLANTQVSSYEQQIHDDSQNPVDTAIRVIDYYMARPYEASILDQRIVYTCRTLITLAKFKKEAECGHLESALTNFYSLDIVPSSVDMNLIQKKASSFNSLDESICRVLPLTLVSVATVLSALYQQISISRSAERESRLTTIKQKMSAILAFCGMIQYQIPGDMFAKMNRLNAMMG